MKHWHLAGVLQPNVLARRLTSCRRLSAAATTSSSVPGEARSPRLLRQARCRTPYLRYGVESQWRAILQNSMSPRVCSLSEKIKKSLAQKNKKTPLEIVRPQIGNIALTT